MEKRMTTVELAIWRLKSIIANYPPHDAIHDMVEMLERLRPKERQDLEDAYNAGAREYLGKVGSEYFENTFGK